MHRGFKAEDLPKVDKLYRIFRDSVLGKMVYGITRRDSVGEGATYFHHRCVHNGVMYVLEYIVEPNIGLLAVVGFDGKVIFDGRKIEYTESQLAGWVAIGHNLARFKTLSGEVIDAQENLQRGDRSRDSQNPMW
jgi:hypothetical protein